MHGTFKKKKKGHMVVGVLSHFLAGASATSRAEEDLLVREKFRFLTSGDAVHVGPAERQNIKIPNPSRDSGRRTRWHHGNLQGPPGDVAIVLRGQLTPPTWLAADRGMILSFFF